VNSHEIEPREPLEDHDRGLAFDLPRLVSRRTAVGLLAGGIGSALIAGCGDSDGEATTSLESDMVFSDGYRSQLATVNGSVEDGIALALNVGV
jgi:hypothetical protein